MCVRLKDIVFSKKVGLC